MSDIDKQIDRAREKGLSNDQIRHDLLDKGWSARDINKALEDQKPVDDWPGAFKSIAYAYKALISNPKPALYYIALVAVTGLLELIFIKHLSHGITKQSIISLSTGIENLLFMPYLVRYELSLARGKKISFKQLFSNYLNIFLLVFITYLMMIVIIVAGALLILIPLIWIIPWSILILFPVVDSGYGPTQSLKEAMRLTKNNKSKAWAIVGVSVILLIPVFIVSTIPIVYSLADIFVFLLYQTAAARLYLWLKENNVA